jgi:O-methyltransferase
MNRKIIKKLLNGDVTGELKQKYLTGKTTSEENLSILNTHYINRSEWPSKHDAETMIGHTCLDNIEFLIDEVVANKIFGNFIETGVWGGGACIYAKKLFDSLGENRKVYVADSFAGLPKPEMDRYPQDAGDNHHTYDPLRISLEEVKNNFLKYNCLDDNVIFLKGWFKDTLPTLTSDEKFCIIRLDGDMYSSTMDALVHLYPKLQIGGYCIIDDYALKGCAAAVHDYVNANNIKVHAYAIPGAGANAIFWKKV